MVLKLLILIYFAPNKNLDEFGTYFIFMHAFFFSKYDIFLWNVSVNESKRFPLQLNTYCTFFVQYNKWRNIFILFTVNLKRSSAHYLIVEVAKVCWRFCDLLRPKQQLCAPPIFFCPFSRKLIAFVCLICGRREFDGKMCHHFLLPA